MFYRLFLFLIGFQKLKLYLFIAIVHEKYTAKSNCIIQIPPWTCIIYTISKYNIFSQISVPLLNVCWRKLQSGTAMETRLCRHNYKEWEGLTNADLALSFLTCGRTFLARFGLVSHKGTHRTWSVDNWSASTHAMVSHHN